MHVVAQSVGIFSQSIAEESEPTSVPAPLQSLRSPQSSQSVPSEQALYSSPGPPSSQSASDACIHVLEHRLTQPGEGEGEGEGEGDGDGVAHSM